MKWNSTFSTFSTKQKPPSVRKTCTLRPQSITGQYIKSITHHFDTCSHLGGYAFDDIASCETGAQRNEQTRQCRSGEINQLRSFAKERVREACAPKRQGKTYIANALNQYTAIGATFVPSYDVNGNQALVQTTTGAWTVAYNAGNRPIRWTQDNIVITMTYDRMGRRISYEKIQGDIQSSHVKFLYNDYLCIQQLSMNAPWNVLKTFVWDPTEPLATRPLVFTEGEQAAFYMHDGNKNVTDVIASTSSASDVTHYDYAPFGAVVRAVTADISTQNSSPITHNSELRSANPFRFSSEYHDDDLGLVYYNYRHYNPLDGRWINRDLIEEKGGLNLYCLTSNQIIENVDVMGLHTCPPTIRLACVTSISHYKMEGGKWVLKKEDKSTYVIAKKIFDNGDDPVILEVIIPYLLTKIEHTCIWEGSLTNEEATKIGLIKNNCRVNPESDFCRKSTIRKKDEYRWF